MRSALDLKRQSRRLAAERRALNAHGHVVMPKDIPVAVLIELAQAATRPRSLTAAILGDPLPGRSALDRRMQEDRADARGTA